MFLFETTTYLSVTTLFTGNLNVGKTPGFNVFLVRSDEEKHPLYTAPTFTRRADLSLLVNGCFKGFAKFGT